MNKNRSKWIALNALAATVLLAAACSNGGDGGSGSNQPSAEPSEAPSNMNLTGMPIVNEPIELTFLAPATPTPDWNDVLVFNEYEKMSNININWEMVTKEALSERRNLILSGGTYPDAFHSAGVSTRELIMYGGQGVFIPLNDLIEEYAPNFSKLLEQYPDIRRGITMPDGNIYAFPRIFDPEFTSVLSGSKLYINNNFLEALDMESPQTLDEFYAYLKAVKEQNPLGNGQNNEIPLSVNGGDARLINILKGAFGLGNRGNSHPFVDLDPETNELRFIPTDERFKELLQYLNKLYSEGLINQDLYTVKSEETAARAADGLFGSIITTNPTTAYETDYFVGAEALIGPHGDQVYSNVTSSLVDTGGFVITDKNQHLAETVRWIDYFYGDEGSRLFFMGIEGETYVVNEDGSVEYSDLINNNPEGLSYTQALSKYTTWRNGGYPAIVTERYFKGSEGQPDALEAAERIGDYYPEEVWAPFNYTLEESEMMSTIGADIESFVEEMRARFIIGQDSLDASWDNYVRTLEQMGLDRYMEIYQSAYERYQQGD